MWGFAHPTASIFGEGWSKHPLRTLDGCADLLWGVKPDFEFLGGVQRTLRTHVPMYGPFHKKLFKAPNPDKQQSVK